MTSQEKQGGEGEEQDDGEAEEKRKNRPRITVVNYFFTNFPPEWNEGNLREVFAELGEVADVYVARKLSKVGLRFGFVRFFRVGNPQVLEKRLNKIWNGSFKLRANVAKFGRSFCKFKEGCKKARNSNPHGSDQIPSKNLTGWLQDAVVGECIVIHTASELLSILRQPFNVSDCKVNHLGGSRILLEFRNEKEGYHSSTNFLEPEMSVEVGADRIVPIVEGGFSSNYSGEIKDPLNPNVEEVFSNHVVQQQDPADDDKDVKYPNGKGDEIISGSPITVGSVEILLNHNGDGDNNHVGDGFGDIEGAVTEKAPHDVDTSCTREPKQAVIVGSDSQKRDPVFEEVVTVGSDSQKRDPVIEVASTGKQLISNLKVVKNCDDIECGTNKAQRNNKLTPLAPNGLRSSKKAVRRQDPRKIDRKHRAKDETLLSHGEKAVTVIDDFWEKKGSEKKEAVDSSTLPAQGIERDILNLKSKLAQLKKDLQI